MWTEPILSTNITTGLKVWLFPPLLLLPPPKPLQLLTLYCFHCPAVTPPQWQLASPSLLLRLTAPPPLQQLSATGFFCPAVPPRQVPPPSLLSQAPPPAILSPPTPPPPWQLPPPGLLSPTTLLPLWQLPSPGILSTAAYPHLRQLPPRGFLSPAAPSHLWLLPTAWRPLSNCTPTTISMININITPVAIPPTKTWAALSVSNYRGGWS